SVASILIFLSHPVPVCVKDMLRPASNFSKRPSGQVSLSSITTLPISHIFSSILSRTLSPSSPDTVPMHSLALFVVTHPNVVGLRQPQLSYSLQGSQGFTSGQAILFYFYY